jgi:hypothetical protein
MDGVGGYEGWRWIFSLEGIVTVILGIAGFSLLIDSPALSGRWLEPEEIRLLELKGSSRTVASSKKKRRTSGGRM